MIFEKIRNIKFLCFLLLSFWIFVGCNYQKSGAQNFDQEGGGVLPGRITGVGERLGYQSNHYWDSLNVKDSLHTLNAEQAIVNYIALLSSLTPKQVDSSLTIFLNKIVKEPKLFLYFNLILEKYLYHPNSPLQNEAVYLKIIGYSLEAPNVSKALKIRLQQQLEILQKNKIGEIAKNIVFNNFDGKRNSLHELKSAYTLVLFYDPECDNCKKMITSMVNSSLLGNLDTDNRKLRILALYTEKNTKLWKSYASFIPKNWINGYDRTGKIFEKYDLRAIPSLYLLDKDKKVLLKDSKLEEVFRFFST